MLKDIENTINLIRNKKPVILNLTNFVTMDFVANSLLAIGAAPIMTQSEKELEELIKISSAVYINIGTLDDLFLKKVYHTINSAQQYKKPIILDPVGAGATVFRTENAKKIAESASIIRGNASEIISFIDDVPESKGVESINETKDAKSFAIKLAKKYSCTVAISGATDFATDANRDCEISYGSNLMPFVTGMGCSLTSVIAAFRAVINDSFIATKMAIEYFTLCGSQAALNSISPASFKINLLDALYLSDFRSMKKLYNSEGGAKSEV